MWQSGKLCLGRSFVEKPFAFSPGYDAIRIFAIRSSADGNQALFRMICHGRSRSRGAVKRSTHML